MSNAREIADEKAILEAAGIEILNSNGEKIKFGSIFEDKKTVVVFIRHFFCGSCQTYVEDLAALPQEALDQAGTKIVVVGCGEASVIEHYIEKTRFSGEVYANPSRTLYRALGMTIETTKTTPAGEERKSYLKQSPLSIALSSIWSGIKNASLVGKQGNVSQLGGDFVFGPGKTCSFAHRMQHTEDHLEVADLMKEAGIVLA